MRFPPQGGPLSGRNAYDMGNNNQVGLLTARHGIDGSGIGGGVGYLHPVYRNSYNTGAMSGSGDADGCMGDMALVGAGWTQLQ